jgi:TPR repeat protein
MRAIKAGIAAVVLTLCVCAPVLAGQLDDGVAAAFHGDYETAWRLLQPLADQGSAKAQTEIAHLYAQGKGVSRSYDKAVQWYRKAINQGFLFAQGGLDAVNLGIRAERGEAKAQHNLGMSILLGTDYFGDPLAYGLRWLRKAAEHGNAVSYVYLGEVYSGQFFYLDSDALDGSYLGTVAPSSTPPSTAGALERSLARQAAQKLNEARRLLDYAEAVKWFAKGAVEADRQISSRAMANLGSMYAKGRGVPQDFIVAHMWFNLAAARAPGVGYVESLAKDRDTIAKRMTPAQIAEAQKLAREWKPKK